MQGWELDGPTLLQVVARSFVVYVAMVVLLRLSGKRQIGQMTPFDLVLLLLISNAVQNAMTGPDTSVSGGLVAAGTLLAANHAASWLRLRYPSLRSLLVGSPVVLVQDGHVQFSALQREQMTLDDLMANLRLHDCPNVGDCAQATLEVDGEVSVLRSDSHRPDSFARSKKRLVRHHKH